ncbi:DMT family transporter [Pseudomonas sp. LP_7_YM]|uniref:DMT family transporter n=1 Tax=Pseudomonas sp. LP_7_YM TaxID=2485137 RepID=UPI00105E7D01|nr:DMT family transporter [Pseudomonas sp. LP_7_YM]TDV59263.1 threonine/homoserine efflux transporter RhtA [Pseudomonas sp. LP_7_YM]
MNAKYWALALVLITALWGWSFVAIHIALQEVTAPSFNALRFITGAVVMLPFVYARLVSTSLSDYLQAGAVGVALFCAFAFQTSGIKYTTASNASFITGLAIVFTPIFSLLILKARPTFSQALGGAIATTGLGMLTLRGLEIHVGDLLVLVCAIFTALHIIVLSEVSKKVEAAVLAFVQIAVVGVLSLLWSVMDGGFQIPASGSVMSAVLIIGVIGTAAAYFIQTKAQIASPPARIALILVLEPVFGGVFGYFLGGDRLGVVNLVGACLIVAGMVVTEFEAEAVRKWRIRTMKLKN